MTKQICCDRGFTVPQIAEMEDERLNWEQLTLFFLQHPVVSLHIPLIYCLAGFI